MLDCIHHAILKIQLRSYALMQWCCILRLHHKIVARQFPGFLCTKHYWKQWQTNLNIENNSKMMRCAVTALPCFLNSWLWIQVCVYQIGSWANCLHINCHFIWCKRLLIKNIWEQKSGLFFINPRMWCLRIGTW